MKLIKELMARYQASHLGRTLTLYGHGGGSVLAGGTAYSALFSIFGALVAGFSIFGLLLAGHQDLLDEVIRATAAAVPGLISMDGEKGVIEPQTLLSQPSLFSTTGIIAFVIALFSGLVWVDALRQAVQVLAGATQNRRNFVLTKVVDAGWLFFLGGLIVLAAGTSIAMTAIGGFVMDTFGLEYALSRTLIRLGGFAAIALLYSATVFVTFRWLARLTQPFRQLAWPALACGLVSAVLTQFSGLFVRSSGSNPLLATGALLVTLLVLFNLLSRVVLYGAAWIAAYDTPAEQTVEDAVDLTKTAPVVAAAPPATVRASTYDRIVLAAGAVLGATAALGVSAVVRAVNTLTGRSES